MADITNLELQKRILDLEKKLDENTAINKQLISLVQSNTDYNRQLLELLKLNNSHTKDIHDYITVELSTEQQLKDFGLNIAANLIGNTVDMPTVINLSNLLKNT